MTWVVVGRRVLAEVQSRLPAAERQPWPFGSGTDNPWLAALAASTGPSRFAAGHFFSRSERATFCTATAPDRSFPAACAPFNSMTSGNAVSGEFDADVSKRGRVPAVHRVVDVSDEELELGSSDDDDEDTMSTTEGDDESEEEDLDFGDFEMPPE